MTHTHSDEAILAHLKSGNTLTPASAMSLFGCAAMHSAAARLREQGYNIICRMKSENNRRFGEYRLTGESCGPPAGGANPPSPPPSQSSQLSARPYAAPQTLGDLTGLLTATNPSDKSAGVAPNAAKEQPNCALRGGCIMKPGQCAAVGYCLNDIALAHPNAAQPSRPEKRVIEESPSGAVAAAGFLQVMDANGKWPIENQVATVTTTTAVPDKRILGAPTCRGLEVNRPLEPTQGEAAIHHPAPECKGEIAARERLEPEGPLEATAEMSKPKLRDAQNGVTGRRDGQFPNGEIIHLGGKPLEVVFEGISEYDGTRYCSVRDAR